MSRTRGIAAVVNLALFALAGAVQAQEREAAEAGLEEAPGVSVSDGGNRVAYGPEYFARYNVVTASDQLERIPGLQGLLGGGGGDQRGFGNSGDQILINGKRLSGKSIDIGSTLDRIQARQVTRIEVIRGMVAGLDVRSRGRVVNVVLSETLVTGYGSWEGTLSHYSDGRQAPGVELNYAGDVGALNYLVSAGVDPFRDRTARSDLFYGPDGALFERQLESAPAESEEYSFTANTSYGLGNGDILNLNALWSREDEVEEQLSDRYLGGPLGERFDRHVLIHTEDLTDNWEIGGDYEHIQANGNVLTGLFVWTQRSGDEQSAFEETEADAPTVLEEVQAEVQESSEKILRGTYQWGISDNSSWESGAELALNTLEQDVRLFEDAGGVLEEQVLFNQDSVVEEQRVEAFTTYSRQVNEALYLESSVDLEFSELSQEGSDVSRSRDFFFARPRLVLRYDLGSQTQLRGRIEKTVSQLDFGDFVSSFTRDDNRADVISAGNPELEPEQAWEYELTWERRLADDLGLVSVTGTYRDIRDQIGRIPLLVRDEDGTLEERTATGNVPGEATFMELSFSGSLRLSALGLPRAIVEASVEVAETEVTDPFTGRKRDFNFFSPWDWSLGFRHDTRWRNFSYGFTAEQEGPYEQYDLDYREEGESDADIEIFAEMQPTENLTLRLDIEETLRAESSRERLQFIGSRADGVLERRELRASKPVREITFSVRGVF